MGKARPQTPGPNELFPVVIGTGPKLRYTDGMLRISIGSNATQHPIGKGANEAATLVTYTSAITRQSADSLTFEGRTVIGWLLLDGEGQVLGRLVNDDEEVYRRDQVDAFAAGAGLEVVDWGEVADTRIDALLKTPRTDRGPTTLGATRREWVLFLAMASGMLVSWPFLTHVTFSSERGRALVLFGIAATGLGVGALALWVGRKLAKLPDPVVLIGCLLLAAALLVASVVVSLAGMTFWQLTHAQLGAVVLGLAGLVAAMPFWARVYREPVRRPVDPRG